jgi:hypothetical protein
MALTGSSSYEDGLRLGWIAGLIEGEGWLGIQPPARPTVQVITTDHDVVLRLHEWSGVGNVSGPHAGTNKPTYRWVVTKREDAGRLLEAILPLLAERRAERARDIIALWRASPPKRGTAPTCGRGHDLVPPNLVLVDGRRRCLKCQARRQREHRARKAAAP